MTRAPTSVTFSFAGVHVTLFASDPAVPLRLRPYYHPFINKRDGAPADADYRVSVRGQVEPDSPPGQALWSNNVWRLKTTKEGRITIDVIQGNGDWRRSADVSADFACGDIYIPPADEVAPFALTHPTDQVVLLGRLSHLGGAMLHASSAQVNGRAYIFCGTSGAGKTTIVRAWAKEGAAILNDDRTVLRVIDGQVHAGAAPWHGAESTVTPGLFPVAGVFFLHKGRTNVVSPLDADNGFRRLLASAFTPVYLPQAVSRVIHTLDAAASLVPCSELMFTPDAASMTACVK